MSLSKELNSKSEGTLRECYVRPNGADRQWVEVPPRQLSVNLVADKRLRPATGRTGPKPCDKGHLGWLSNPTGRNTCEA